MVAIRKVNRFRTDKSKCSRSQIPGRCGHEFQYGCSRATPLQLQFLKCGPESLAVRFLNPVLSELIGRRAPRAHDHACAAIAVHSSANPDSEAVRRARRGGNTWLKQRSQQEHA